MAHTPGEWVDGPFGDVWVGVRKVNGKWDEVSPGSARIVASFPKPDADFTADEIAANRALTAAAPNALAALRYARNLIGPDEIIDAAITRSDHSNG